jgi:hypothetical protein
MRSWLTAMPGEVLSCAGCHESRNSAPAPTPLAAAIPEPDAITPWYGPVRGFSFVREVQPVLDAYCVSCHDGAEPDRPDFTPRDPVHPQAGNDTYNRGTRFTPAYLALRRYVRAPSIESDLHLLTPGEYHADTTRLIRLLDGGHHVVELSAEAMDRLVTWIDLGAPAHGTWTEIVGAGRVEGFRHRRRETLRRYAGVDDDPERVPGPASFDPVVPSPDPTPTLPSEVRPAPGVRPAGEVRIGLGDGIEMVFVRMTGGPGRDLLIGKYEVTNEQFRRFHPDHSSRLESGDFLQFSERERGYSTDADDMPVCRVSFSDAEGFCAWLSGRARQRFRLPTLDEWRTYCASGTAGGRAPEREFADFANLADASLRHVDTFGWGLPSGAVPPWRPAADADDGYRVSAPVGSYRGDAFGLHDVYGNVAEWVRSGGSSSGPALAGACGGSWASLPRETAAENRATYPVWRRVFDVGFRVVGEVEREAAGVAADDPGRAP